MTDDAARQVVAEWAEAYERLQLDMQGLELERDAAQVCLLFRSSCVDVWVWWCVCVGGGGVRWCLAMYHRYMAGDAWQVLALVAEL